MKMVIVILRRPNMSDKNERRSDPFWEFGSFGCTKCHSKNLMNTKKANDLEGFRFAFAQGGPEGFKLIHVTPPVRVKKHRDRCEVKWTPTQMPLKYKKGLLLIANSGATCIQELKAFISTVCRDTWQGKFASAFRSKRKPLNPKLALKIFRTYQSLRRKSQTFVARSYEEALPQNPPIVDRNRKFTYRKLISEAKLNIYSIKRKC